MGLAQGERRSNAVLAPFVPVPNVEVGAADASAPDRHSALAGPDLDLTRRDPHRVALQHRGDSEEQRNDERHGVLLMVSWRGKSTCVLHGAVRRIKIAIEP